MSAPRVPWLGTFLPAVALSLITTVASAQSSNTVLLEAHDNSVAISGELVEATDGQYQIVTIAGILAIDIDSVKCSGDACPPVEQIFVVGAEIKLNSTDGTISTVGTIVDIVDGQYVLDMALLGRIGIDTELVNCTGPGCPTGLRFATETATAVDADATAEIGSEPVSVTQAETAKETEAAELTNQFGRADTHVSFAGSDTVGLGLLPYLIEDYAVSINASTKAKKISDTETLVSYVDSDDTVLNSMFINANRFRGRDLGAGNKSRCIWHDIAPAKG